jgi:hypothetical protein
MNQKYPNSINYLPDDTEIKDAKLLWWQKQGLQQTATGYGSKLTTTKLAKYNGRFYRVYCMIYGNIGSCYIMTKGQRLFLR